MLGTGAAIVAVRASGMIGAAVLRRCIPRFPSSS